MESLKPLAEITESDVRHKVVVTMDALGGIFRTPTLEGFHRRAASIELHPGVPEAIRSHFETARNLILYSWFYYPFNVTAQLTAYTTVEYALRTKFNDRKTPLAKLLKQAVDSGLIRDQGFSVPVRKAAAIRESNEGLPPEFQYPEPPLIREYSDVLTQTIPFLRNELAHGTTMLHNYGAFTVRICAELINQLFPNPDLASAQSLNGAETKQAS